MTDKMKSFLKGLIFGLVGTGRLIGKDPVAYLYNGVQLPALPEWDRGAYPYAYMHGWGGSIENGNNLWFYAYTDYPLERTELVAGAVFQVPLIPNLHRVGSYLSDGVWSEMAESISEEGTGAAGYVFWSNFDILNDADEVIQPASEPVPVYE